MANNKNAKDNLKPCKKGETNNPNGRPKKLVNAILEQLKKEGAEEITAQMVNGAISTMLSLTPNQILAISNNKEDYPIIIFQVARGLASKKGFEVFEKLLDRVHGKAIQKTEVKNDITSKGEKLNGIIPIEWINDSDK